LSGAEPAQTPESSSTPTNPPISTSDLEPRDDAPKDASTQFPYGLEVLHEPKIPSANPVQIIFVHGLGGSKRGTWTHSKTEFWPDWLHDEKGLEGVRLLAFGYNSAFKPLAPNNNLSIPIFADQLLDDMNDLRYRNGSVRLLVHHANGRGGLYS
jgi:hypothetical protein